MCVFRVLGVCLVCVKRDGDGGGTPLKMELGDIGKEEKKVSG